MWDAVLSAEDDNVAKKGTQILMLLFMCAARGGGKIGALLQDVWGELDESAGLCVQGWEAVDRAGEGHSAMWDLRKRAR